MNARPLVAIISKAFPGGDGLVCKVELQVVQGGTRKAFSRPVKDIVLLLSPKTDSC